MGSTGRRCVDTVYFYSKSSFALENIMAEGYGRNNAPDFSAYTAPA